MTQIKSVFKNSDLRMILIKKCSRDNLSPQINNLRLFASTYEFIIEQFKHEFSIECVAKAGENNGSDSNAKILAENLYELQNEIDALLSEKLLNPVFVTAKVSF